VHTINPRLLHDQYTESLTDEESPDRLGLLHEAPGVVHRSTGIRVREPPEHASTPAAELERAGVLVVVVGLAVDHGSGAIHDVHGPRHAVVIDEPD